MGVDWVVYRKILPLKLDKEGKAGSTYITMHIYSFGRLKGKILQLKQDHRVEQIFWVFDPVYFHLKKYILPSDRGAADCVQLYMLFVNWNKCESRPFIS